jgi:hypothetical protein
MSALPLPARGQEKKPDDKHPKLLFASPLGIVAGTQTKLTLRGLRIDETSEVQATVGDAIIELKLGERRKEGGDNAKRSGDSQVEIELAIPADAKGNLKIVAVAPVGTTEPYVLPVNTAEELEQEKEPNNGLDLSLVGRSSTTEARSSQPLPLGKVMLGRIERSQDVDVYAIELAAGQKTVVEIQARQLGSPLDAALTLFSARGNVQASSDDTSESADGRIEFTPSEGRYFIAVMDANDQGGPHHGYRLTVRQQ